MKKPDINALKSEFEKYARSLIPAGGEAPKAMECKIFHTWDVCALCLEIAQRSPDVFDSRGVELAELCGLFHDVSRFVQYRDYGTFLDGRSFDHGVRSSEIFMSEFNSAGLPHHEAEIVSVAVSAHNKIVLPEGVADHILPYAKIIRDADKIAILDLFIGYFAENSDYLRDEAIKLGLEDSDTFTPGLVETAISGGMIKHRDIRNMNDFKVSMFAWMNDYNFPASAKTLLEKGRYRKFMEYLPESPQIDRLLSMTEERLSRLACS